MTIEVPEDGWHCPMCEAGLWIDTTAGQHYLMRLGEVEIEDCIMCQNMHVMVRE